MRILITAGPTWEPIDAVRFIGNRSSGKLGLALVEAALNEGHQVSLLLGPGVATPSGPATRIDRFESSSDLAQLLDQHFPNHDVLIMAAAVADYRPQEVHCGKRQRKGTPDSTSSWVLRLELQPDLVAHLGRTKRPDQRIVAFALEEPQNLQRRGAEKLKRKHVDAIIANSLDTMESDEIQGLWLTADGHSEQLPRMNKAAFAGWLMRAIKERL